MSMLTEVLRQAITAGASDIHIKRDQPPLFRVEKKLAPGPFEPIAVEQIRAIVSEILPFHLRRDYDVRHEVDFSYKEDGVGRFRVSLYDGEGCPVMALRYVKDKIPALEDLNLPPVLETLVTQRTGIVILSGTTGCGKSTTLAALIEQINLRLRRRIVTIEDPIEYAFTDKLSAITQREVGLDTESFAAALRHVLRQDPDVVLIGEMRDMDSVRTGITAAETGHLIFSTLHSGTAAAAVPRLLDMFPVEEQEQVRMAIASNLSAIVCQRLVPTIGGGVIPAAEVMFNTPTVKKLIMKNQLNLLGAAIETGGEHGMQNFNQALFQLIKGGVVSEADGMRFATNPDSLQMNLRGIFLDEGRKILSSL
ncbi:MAG: PilT/PilU family type 4a pilus ATPase [Kiritimatiellae bacterium]|nr:PilT/PilU family type 4a pilus ATPase [Kiritimatiellia bacterium]